MTAKQARRSIQLTCKLVLKFQDFKGAKSRNEEMQAIADLITIRELLCNFKIRIYPSFLEKVDDVIGRFMYYFSTEIVDLFLFSETQYTTPVYDHPS